ncbi:MAG: hypothetical protein M0R80_21515, partial [Proteobacteria bacterium]|nr:hypothetical protein [Pseudomonadota bacterium]
MTPGTFSAAITSQGLPIDRLPDADHTTDDFRSIGSSIPITPQATSDRSVPRSRSHHRRLRIDRFPEADHTTSDFGSNRPAMPITPQATSDRT